MLCKGMMYVVHMKRTEFEKKTEKKTKLHLCSESRAVLMKINIFFIHILYAFKNHAGNHETFLTNLWIFEKETKDSFS